jgi:hypothetical protein
MLFKTKSDNHLPISEVCYEDQMRWLLVKGVLKYVLIKLSVHEIVLSLSEDEI